MDVVLDEKVDHGNQGAKEGVRKQLAVPLGFGVLGRALEGHDYVRDGADKVDTHGDVVDVVIVGGSDIDPAATSHSSDHVVGEEELCETL